MCDVGKALWGKSGGQALIEEDSSVLVTLGAQDSGMPLLKWLYRFLGQFSLTQGRPAEDDDPTLHLKPNCTVFEEKNDDLPFQMALIGHSLGLFWIAKYVDLGYIKVPV